MKGNCREAIELYKAALGATVNQVMTHGDANIGTAAQKDLIINSQVDIGGQKFHMADNLGMDLISGNQVSFTVILNSPEEVMTAYGKLKVGGAVMLEPTATFFSPCHCGLIDKFGVVWQINCPK